jgi:hypothetical protein
MSMTPPAIPLPVIIDVRECEEYADGYVARAKHLSRGVLEQKIAEVVPDFSTPIEYTRILGEGHRRVFLRVRLGAVQLAELGKWQRNEIREYYCLSMESIEAENQ